MASRSPIFLPYFTLTQQAYRHCRSVPLSILPTAKYVIAQAFLSILASALARALVAALTSWPELGKLFSCAHGVKGSEPRNSTRRPVVSLLPITELSSPNFDRSPQISTDPHEVSINLHSAPQISTPLHKLCTLRGSADPTTGPGSMDPWGPWGLGTREPGAKAQEAGGQGPGAMGGKDPARGVRGQGGS